MHQASLGALTLALTRSGLLDAVSVFSEPTKRLHANFLQEGVYNIDGFLSLLIQPVSQIAIMSESLHIFFDFMIVKAMWPPQVEQHLIQAEHLVKTASDVLN